MFKWQSTQYISSLLSPLSKTHEYNIWWAELGGFKLPLMKSSMGQQGFIYAGPALWNSIPSELKSHQNKGKATFKKHALLWVAGNR